MKTQPKTGTRIRLTAAFLRSTGQYAGSEPHSVWTVQPCDCTLCRAGGFVAVDEPRYDGEGPRHLNVANVEALLG